MDIHFSSPSKSKLSMCLHVRGDTHVWCEKDKFVSFGGCGPFIFLHIFSCVHICVCVFHYKNLGSRYMDLTN